MPSDDVRRFAAMVERGFEAVGCRLPVVIDESCVTVRDVIVEFGTVIECVRASDPESPFMSFPESGLESAAAAVCMSVLSGMVARAVEAAA